MNPSYFGGKTAVITGAGGTLCSAIAKDLASRGAPVALLGRTLASLEGVSAAITAAGGVALPVACDVNDVASVEAACATVAKELGPIWFLLNGAGGNQAEAVTTTTEFDPAELAADKPSDLRGFFNLDLAKFDDVVRTNTLGTVIPSRVFGRELAKLGRGSILNFASMNSYRPLTRVPAYALAKAGVVSFTQWLAVYLAPAGIRVNAVAPGFFVNDRSRKILMKPDGGLSPRGEKVMQHTPLRRFGAADELCGCVRWLLNDEEAGFVTGQTISVDGGFLAASGV
jgi:NAD(P)-dependent dehydrogenase (short-subunit alcohol dehydrogenase family)